MCEWRLVDKAFMQNNIYLNRTLCIQHKQYKINYRLIPGYAMAQLVEALRYKSEGRGFDFRWCPSGHTVALGSTQPLTEMSTRNTYWGAKAAGA